MNTYTILTNGVQTHRFHGDELPTLTSAFERKGRALTGPHARSGKIVAVISVAQRTKDHLREKCPEVGQEFATLAEAARFLGANVQSLYCSYKGERREAGCYSIWGIEFGYVNKA